MNTLMTVSEVIKLFSCSAQLRLKFILLINVKMPTIIGINHGFQCSNIRRITRKVFEHKAAGRVFEPLLSDPENV